MIINPILIFVLGLGVAGAAYASILTSILAPILSSGICVLVGISATEIVFAFIYYILVRDLTKGKNKLEDKIQSKMQAKAEK